MIVVKPGRMAVGAKAAATHTGALADLMQCMTQPFVAPACFVYTTCVSFVRCARLLGRLVPRGSRF